MLTGMTETSTPESMSPRPPVSPGALVLLALTAALAFLVVSVSYGLAREYGDTSATDARVAAQSFRDWGIGIVLVVGLAGWAVTAARRSRGRRAMTVIAAVATLVTLIGLPAAAVVGVHQKFDAYPDVPPCTAGFRTGPAVPVVRAAQAGFAELDHPGPFSGGGSSGLGGCSSQLMVDEHADVPALYRDTLTGSGWQLRQDGPDLVLATKDGQDFEVSRAEDGSWQVWIGPAGLQPQTTQSGEVAPRR
jgi:hypothetical protein